MYDSFAASCDQPIHLINIISISNLAMSLLKKMSLHLYICTQCCQAWHIHLQFNNIFITRYAVGPAIDARRMQLWREPSARIGQESGLFVRL